MLRKLLKLSSRRTKFENKIFNFEIFLIFQEQELRDIIVYLAGLHYVDLVDYAWMREMIKRVAKRISCSLQEPYDWQLMTGTTSTSAT